MSTNTVRPGEKAPDARKFQIRMDKRLKSAGTQPSKPPTFERGPRKAGTDARNQEARSEERKIQLKA
ncbi:uncharacterized protein G2W53_015910 [Senna tora]|uniref:Uncharacterized protein n=1 Tax=Senna tora TaxID=362788 RepID=A0A834WWM2_9FABA|nr:uncharacterized protein G2W53_015910 [Senna tora]